MEQWNVDRNVDYSFGEFEQYLEYGMEKVRVMYMVKKVMITKPTVRFQCLNILKKQHENGSKLEDLLSLGLTPAAVGAEIETGLEL